MPRTRQGWSGKGLGFLLQDATPVCAVTAVCARQERHGDASLGRPHVGGLGHRRCRIVTDRVQCDPPT